VQESGGRDTVENVRRGERPGSTLPARAMAPATGPGTPPLVTATKSSVSCGLAGVCLGVVHAEGEGGAHLDRLADIR
jgi:hypothetical protein